jgi:hypothetical protein
VSNRARHIEFGNLQDPDGPKLKTGPGLQRRNLKIWTYRAYGLTLRSQLQP